ncbi:fumarylacetoacetate hydrolase family protein [Planctomyces sp. SH-PL62]|uniref:fumarylacetoacetate hydrolase family protein n=1 Tax=Planctomyces sp. SH-PL62 TaxID=1636152 RepID=UPI00078DD45A|nr:fumarylacetoacetate hydrolase family protein [Planctomyces sp. SH-PL62]AMV37525.1 Ureidoglycolate lyase [Planctomyces sp. SH-PL62]
MRFVTVETDRGPRACGVRNEGYVDLNAADPGLPASVKAILALGPDGVRRAAEATAKAATTIDPATVRLLPPIPDPQKVLCIGLNYRDHAIESGAEIPAEPVLFSKYPNTLIAHGEPIVLPPESAEVDFEAELVVVIGRGGRRIPRERALEHVGGYMPGHDVSARDWQLNKPAKQWTAGKTFDTFAPTGPALTSADEIPDPQALGIRLRLNGETMQDSSTAQFIFGVAEVVSYLSNIMTLAPGDLIFTGTPPGVGMARKPPRWLKPGDVAEVEIDGLGTLQNPVVAESR